MMTRSFAAVAAVATLIAGSANAAEDFQVGISGFVNAGFLASDVENNSAEYDAASIRTDNLVNFTGSTVLDNGLKVSAVAGFSLAQGSSQSDLYQEELYVEVGGSFGDVRLGRARNAGALLHSYIPSAGVGTFAIDDARMSAVIGTTSAGAISTASSIGQGEYANRVTYFTPRIEGVQLAASFTPETDSTHNPALDGYNRYNSGSIQNEYSLAGNYSRDLNGLGVVASVGYTAGDHAAGTSSVRDSEALHAGLSLAYAGFTFGGAWGKYEDPTVTSGYTQTYGAGVKYVTGPWGFGASAMLKEASDATIATTMTDGTNNVEKQNFYEVGATYALGSGVSTGAAVYYNDNQDRIGGGDAQDSLAGVVNLSVAF